MCLHRKVQHVNYPILITTMDVFSLRDVKKPKKKASDEGDGEPSTKKAKVEEPETTTVKKVVFVVLAYSQQCIEFCFGSPSSDIILHFC